MSHILSKLVEEQPKRMEYAKKKLTDLGYEITFEDKTRLEFYHNGHKVVLYPYTGWHTGKSIKDGRGIHNLLPQLNQQK